ncbi:MAG: GDSL-type esterase/lipase family protein [Thermoguttaceae bacterium]|nr:GDSL-type esterase/lipase family protein [Thermoguttaceae bacterium]
MKLKRGLTALLVAVFMGCGYNLLQAQSSSGSGVALPPRVEGVRDDSVALKPDNKLSEGWWKQRFESQSARMAQGNVDLLMIGDSITHFWEGKGKTVWEEYYGDRNAMNFGISADRTEHVIWRLLHSPLDKINPKLAVVMIGTNNIGHKKSTPTETVAGIREIVCILKQKLPGTKILLLEVFPRGNKPDNEYRIQVNEINTLLRKTFAKVQGVHVMSLEKLFLDKDGTLPAALMPDFLHPNTDGYAIWAKAMEGVISQTLGDKPKVTEAIGIPKANAKWWLDRFESKNELLKQGNFDILMIGDSITHGWEASGKAVWDKYYGDKKAINLGFSGDCTQHVIWRLEHSDFSKVNPKLAVILIGVNNSFSSTAENIALGNKKICEILHAKFPKMKIIVLNVFPFGDKNATVKHEKIAAINKSLKEVLSQVDYVNLVNINPVFLDADGNLPASIMPDYLHPNAVGYEKWGAALDAMVKQAL